MSESKTNPQAPINVKVGLPCEAVTNYLLPLVRRLLAQELVNRHGMSQVRTAKILGVTQPAISNYLSTELRLRRSPLEDGLEEVREMVKALAQDLLNGRLTQFELMNRICGLCVRMRSGGPICAIHGEDVPAIEAYQCSFCIIDQADLRQRSLEEYEFVEEVRRAVRILEGSRDMASLIPEIGLNVTYAKPEAESVEDVVGVPGRIHPVSGRPRASNPPEFGGSNHVARAVLTMMKFEPSLRSAISLKFDWEFVEICKNMGLVVSFYDRREEPPEVKSVDGRTIPWGVRRAVEEIGSAPDVIYDLGDLGKEPMIFLYGRTASDVAGVSDRIAKEYVRRRINGKKN